MLSGNLKIYSLTYGKEVTMIISPKVRPIRFWSQKVLPLVYDDSLSYYEVLCKFRDKLNELIGFVTDNIEDMVKEVIEKYFAEITYTESTQSINFILEDDEDA